MSAVYLATIGSSYVKALRPDWQTILPKWLHPGVYVTKAVTAQFPKYQAVQFSNKATSLGFQNTEEVAVALRASKLKLVGAPTLNAWAGSAAIEDESGNLNKLPIPRAQYRYVASLFSITTVSDFLETFATVQLDVKPVPPRDYKVVINGDDCPTTDKAVYRVLPGVTTVNVTRAKKPPCTWNGDIPAGKEQLVSCKL
jgi:hypothetical protein